MTVKRLLPSQRISDASGLPSREFVEIVQRIVGDIHGLAVDVAFLSQVVGLSQTPENVSASRTHSTSYQNTTGRCILVNVSAISTVAAGRAFQISDDNATWLGVGVFPTSSGQAQTVTALVLPDWYYRINAAVTISQWVELR